MKVRNVITGVVSTERADIAGALIRQGLCEELATDATSNPLEELRANQRATLSPVPSPQPQWSVEIIEGVSANSYVAILLTIGSEKRTYCGAPEDINRKRVWDGGCNYLNGLGFEVPDRIVKEYTAAWKSNPKLRGAFSQQLGTVIARGYAQNQSNATNVKSNFYRTENEELALADQAAVGFDLEPGEVIYELGDPARG